MMNSLFIHNSKKVRMKIIEQLHFIILNTEGEIIFSDNTLFSEEDIPSNYIFDWSPFVESIFPQLLKFDKRVYTFEKVKTIHSFLTGIYDYSFYKNDGKNAEDQIIWVITDCSTFYEKMTRRQQIDHQKVIDEEVARFKAETIPTIEFAQV